MSALSTLVACEDDDPAADHGAPDAGAVEDAGNSDAGPVDGYDERCSIEDASDVLLTGSTPVDCGEIRHDDTDADAVAAQQCALAAQAAGDAFLLRFYPQGTDSIIAWFYLSRGDGSVIQLNYDSDPSGGGNAGASIGKRECASFGALPDCTPRASDVLCLRCDGLSESHCREAPGQ